MTNTIDKDNHEHIFGKYVIKESFDYDYTQGVNIHRFSTYRKCSICGKLESYKLPQEIINACKKNVDDFTFAGSYYYDVFWMFGFKKRDEVEFIEKNFSDIVEVIYLEKIKENILE